VLGEAPYLRAVVQWLNSLWHFARDLAGVIGVMVTLGMPSAMVIAIL